MKSEKRLLKNVKGGLNWGYVIGSSDFLGPSSPIPRSGGVGASGGGGGRFQRGFMGGCTTFPFFRRRSEGGGGRGGLKKILF